MSEIIELLLPFLRVVAPILLVGITIAINRLLGWSYPWGGVSCAIILLALIFTIQYIDSLFPGTPSSTEALDSIFDIAVPILFLAITISLDYAVLNILRKKN